MKNTLQQLGEKKYLATLLEINCDIIQLLQFPVYLSRAEYTQRIHTLKSENEFFEKLKERMIATNFTQLIMAFEEVVKLLDETDPHLKTIQQTLATVNTEINALLQSWYNNTDISQNFYGFYQQLLEHVCKINYRFLQIKLSIQSICSVQKADEAKEEENKTIELKIIPKEFYCQITTDKIMLEPLILGYGNTIVDRSSLQNYADNYRDGIIAANKRALKIKNNITALPLPIGYIDPFTKKEITIDETKKAIELKQNIETFLKLNPGLAYKLCVDESIETGLIELIASDKLYTFTHHLHQHFGLCTKPFRQGLTLLHIACQLNKPLFAMEIVELIKAHNPAYLKIIILQKDNFGLTPLMYAAFLDMEDVLSVMMSHVAIKNPIMLAIKQGVIFEPVVINKKYKILCNEKQIVRLLELNNHKILAKNNDKWQLKINERINKNPALLTHCNIAPLLFLEFVDVMSEDDTQIKNLMKIIKEEPLLCFKIYGKLELNLIVNIFDHVSPKITPNDLRMLCDIGSLIRRTFSHLDLRPLLESQVSRLSNVKFSNSALFNLLLHAAIQSWYPMANIKIPVFEDKVMNEWIVSLMNLDVNTSIPFLKMIPADVLFEPNGEGNTLIDMVINQIATHDRRSYVYSNLKLDAFLHEFFPLLLKLLLKLPKDRLNAFKEKYVTYSNALNSHGDSLLHLMCQFENNDLREYKYGFLSSLIKIFPMNAWFQKDWRLNSITPLRLLFQTDRLYENKSDLDDDIAIFRWAVFKLFMDTYLPTLTVNDTCHTMVQMVFSAIDDKQYHLLKIALEFFRTVDVPLKSVPYYNAYASFDDFSVTQMCSPLAYACLKGDLTAVKMLLTLHPNLNPHRTLETSSIALPLMCAIASGNKDIVVELIKSGAEINIMDDCALTPMGFACHEQKLDIIACLIENDADLSIETIRRSLLQIACMVGSQPVFELLLKHNAPCQGKETLISFAATSGNVEFFEYIMQCKLKLSKKMSDKQLINCCDNYFGLTPLQCAVKNQRVAMVKHLLLNRHVDPKANQTINVLQVAFFQNNIAIAILLLNTGKFTNKDAKIGWGEANPEDKLNACFLKAAELNHVLLAKFCINEATDKDCFSYQNHLTNPLHYAAQYGNKEMVKLILSLSVYFSRMQDEDGNTPLHLAALHGHDEVYELLMQVANDEILTMTNQAGKTAADLLKTTKLKALEKKILSLQETISTIENGESSLAKIKLPMLRLELTKLKTQYEKLNGHPLEAVALKN